VIGIKKERKKKREEIKIGIKRSKEKGDRKEESG
jgi:hypothetical protein